MALNWLERVKFAFRDVGKSIHKLFLEISGFLFTVFGGLLLLRGYQEYQSALARRAFEFKDYFTIVSFVVFGLLMLGFGVHSFYRVRSMK